MKKTFILLVTVLCGILLSFSVFAHSGKTDSSGGHNSSSGYHYHHGYPAHQHTNGECPYDFEYASNHSAILKESDSETQIDWEAYRKKAKELDEETYNKMKEEAKQRTTTSSNQKSTQTPTNKTIKTKIKNFIEHTKKHLWSFIIIYLILCVLFSYVKEKIKSRRNI